MYTFCHIRNKTTFSKKLLKMYDILTKCTDVFSQYSNKIYTFSCICLHLHCHFHLLLLPLQFRIRQSYCQKEYLIFPLGYISLTHFIEPSSFRPKAFIFGNIGKKTVDCFHKAAIYKDL